MKRLKRRTLARGRRIGRWEPPPVYKGETRRFDDVKFKRKRLEKQRFFFDFFFFLQDNGRKKET
jgi:hypothetical protein